jgi:hypothetical protein
LTGSLSPTARTFIVFGSSLGPEYRNLWAANAISNLGDGVVFVAAPLLAATLTEDPAPAPTG